MADSLVVAERETRALGPMELIQQAITNKVAPEVMRELVALQQSVERFSWEREERQARIDFDSALNACQKQIGLVAPNAKRENNKVWADYVQIDKHVRPVYLQAGFSIGFSEVESADKGRLRMKATVSRGGISREYFADLSRAAANGGMSQADADAAAASRVKRYLMLDIFNIAVGIDRDEKKPFEDNPTRSVLTEGAQTEWVDHIKASSTRAELQGRYLEALGIAENIGDTSSIKAFIAAKDARNLKGFK